MPSSYLSLLRATTLCWYEVFMCLFQNGLGTKPTHISWLVRATPFVKGGKALWKENSGTSYPSPLPPSLVPQPGPLVVGASPPFDHCKWWCILTQIWASVRTGGRMRRGHRASSEGWKDNTNPWMGQHLCSISTPRLQAGCSWSTHSKKLGLVFHFLRTSNQRSWALSFVCSTVPLWMGI